MFSGGTHDRLFRAFDASSGAVLWEFPTNSGIIGQPSSFMVDGKQYVAVQSGWGIDSRTMQSALTQNLAGHVSRGARGRRRLGICGQVASVMRTLVCAALAAVGTIAVSSADDPRLLTGAIDIHVHTAPDNVERSVDGVDAAVMARAHGMRAIVLKNHYDPTAGLAYMVRKQVPGVEVFGGIDLNLPVGGMNPAAVEHMTQVSGSYGRLVWMSTFDAENQVRYSKQIRPFVSVSKDGELLPATKAVIEVIAKHGLVLATGHVSSGRRADAAP